MRTEDAKRADDTGEPQRRTSQQSQASSSMYLGKDMDRSSTPGDNAASNSTDDDVIVRPAPRPTTNITGKKPFSPPL